MAVAVLRNRLFEDRQIPTLDGELLYAKIMLPKPPIVPRRVVFISPLVGAGAAQPLLIFRNLTRRGSILLSFEYRGHGRSSGQFELDNTLADVQHALVWAWNYASRRKLPLHGFATCYGAIPLLAQFTTPGCAWMLASINFISGLFRLDQILRFDDFAAHLAPRLGRKLSRPALLAELRDRSIDCNGEAFRGGLLDYLSGLFPQLRVGSDFFEELQYARVNIPETLLQLSQARYLDGVNVPPEIPCNVFCGRSDAVLGLDSRGGCAAYRDRVLSLVPHAALHERRFDHFGRGPEHDRVIDHLSDIFERYDEPGIPAQAHRVSRRAA